MKMKNSKSRNEINRQHLDEYDLLDRTNKRKRQEPKRRPIRNWKHVWIEHENDEDLEDFYK